MSSGLVPGQVPKVPGKGYRNNHVLTCRSGNKEWTLDLVHAKRTFSLGTSFEFILQGSSLSKDWVDQSSCVTVNSTCFGDSKLSFWKSTGLIYNGNTWKLRLCSWWIFQPYQTVSFFEQFFATLHGEINEKSIWSLIPQLRHQNQEVPGPKMVIGDWRLLMDAQ